MVDHMFSMCKDLNLVTPRERERERAILPLPSLRSVLVNELVHGRQALPNLSVSFQYKQELSLLQNLLQHYIFDLFIFSLPLRSLGTKVTGICELPDMGPRIQTWIPMIQQHFFLADKPSL